MPTSMIFHRFDANPQALIFFIFSQGNDFYGPDLGWPGSLPNGLHHHQDPTDFGADGWDHLREIKCNSGPSWEEGCLPATD